MAYQLDITGEELNYILKNPQPINLLDNSNFIDIINQRQSISYSTAGAYCIDRWKLNEYGGSGNISITSAGLTLTPTQEQVEIAQRLENSSNLIGKNMTFAIKIANSSIRLLNFVWGTSNSTSSTDVNLIHQSANNAIIIRAVNAITIEWAALYEGYLYNSLTLPKYQPKEHSVELAECQRYYYRTERDIALNGYVSSSAKGAYATVYIPNMRAMPAMINALPQMTIRTVGGTYSAAAPNTSPYGTPTSQELLGWNATTDSTRIHNGGMITIKFTFNSDITTNNTPISCLLRGNSYLEFSAEL